MSIYHERPRRRPLRLPGATMTEYSEKDLVDAMAMGLMTGYASALHHSGADARSAEIAARAVCDAWLTDPIAVAHAVAGIRENRQGAETVRVHGVGGA